MATAKTNRCHKCNGLLYGRIEYTADYYCICELSDPPKEGLNMMGWECPRCHKIHSPFSMECDCPPPYITKTTSNTDFKEEQQ